MSDEWKRLNEKGLDEIYFLRERVTELEQCQRGVAEELRGYANLLVGTGYLAALADRLDPPSVVENPPA